MALINKSRAEITHNITLKNAYKPSHIYIYYIHTRARTHTLTQAHTYTHKYTLKHFQTQRKRAQNHPQMSFSQLFHAISFQVSPKVLHNLIAQ